MQKINAFGWAGLAFLYAVFLVIGLPALLGDYLFYRSDIFSLSVLISAAALLLFPLTGIIAYGLSCFPDKKRNSIGRWIAYISATGIIDIFMALALIYLVNVLNFKILNHLIKHPIIALAICVLPAAFIVYRHSDKPGLINRVKHIGGLSLISAPILVAYSILIPFFTADADKHPRNGPHLLLIVLDGWASQTLHSYNPAAPRTDFDEILDDARIYLGAHSSAVWTSAFFGTLYNGDAKVVAGDKRKQRSMMSLPARLQDKQVGVRLMNFHRNGIPDSSAAHRSDHKGLRSYFLTEKYLWIPQGLGLEYHIAMSGRSMAKNFGWALSKSLYFSANPIAHNERDNALIEVLLPELRHIRKKHNKSFTLFHAANKGIGRNATVNLSMIPNAQKSGREVKGKFPTAKVRENNYRYDPKLEPIVAQMRIKAIKSTLQQGIYLKEFMTALRADPMLSNTIVVITADHGTMYEKGRMWYGYHPNREVTRVPFIVFDTGLKGKDYRYFGTPRLTEAIDDFFSQSNPDRKFMSAGSYEEPALSMTLKADIHKEWILVASYPDKAYWINLHPDGSGQSLEMKTEGYRQIETARFDGPPPALASKMEEVLDYFGIDRKKIHSAFHQLGQ